jgi:hypothetical protein
LRYCSLLDYVLVVSKVDIGVSEGLPASILGAETALNMEAVGLSKMLETTYETIQKTTIQVTCMTLVNAHEKKSVSSY